MADITETRKLSKYSYLDSAHCYVPVEGETAGLLSQTSVQGLGDHLNKISGDAKSHSPPSPFKECPWPFRKETASQLPPPHLWRMFLWSKMASFLFVVLHSMAIYVSLIYVVTY